MSWNKISNTHALLPFWPCSSADGKTRIKSDSNPTLGSIFIQSFRPEKLFIKRQSARSIKLVFSEVVKGIKIKITAKFRTSRRLPFEDTEIIMWPEMHPKSFGAVEKRVSGARFSNVPKLFGWHKSLYIFNKNMFQALKLGSYFAFPWIWNILKEQHFTASGS